MLFNDINESLFALVLFLQGSLKHCFASSKSMTNMANQWPPIEKYFSFLLLPKNSLVSVSDPWRVFWAHTAPFTGPGLALSVALTELQIYKDTNRCGVLGQQVPANCLVKATQPLIVRLLKLFNKRTIATFHTSFHSSKNSGGFAPLPPPLQLFSTALLWPCKKYNLNCKKYNLNCKK